MDDSYQLWQITIICSCRNFPPIVSRPEEVICMPTPCEHDMPIFKSSYIILLWFQLHRMNRLPESSNYWGKNRSPVPRHHHVMGSAHPQVAILLKPSLMDTRGSYQEFAGRWVSKRLHTEGAKSPPGERLHMRGLSSSYRLVHRFTVFRPRGGSQCEMLYPPPQRPLPCGPGGGV